MAVRSLREKLWVNGFCPVAVLNGDKRPAGKEWPERARMNPPEAVTAWPDNSALSTGILTDGLVAVDIDIDDSVLMETVLSAAIHFLGDAPKRTRSNSARCLLLYRAVEGEPSKRTLNGSLGKIEALGRGQQFVAFGSHPSGAAYEWSPCAPDTFNRSRLPSISQDALNAFLEAVAPQIGAEAPARPATRPEPRQALPSVSQTVSERDVAYAARALEDGVAKLTVLRPGDGRNAALNTAAHSLGTLVGNGSIDAAVVAHALLEASAANGHTAKHGEAQSKKTIESGLNAGIKKPRPFITDGELPPIDLSGLMEKAKPASKGLSKPSGKRSIALLQGTQIVEEPVSWLWDGYLPLGAC